MSQENLSVEAIINRRERRIVIKLYETDQSLGPKNLPCFEPGDEISGIVSLNAAGGQTPVAHVRIAVVYLEQIKLKTGINSKSENESGLLHDKDENVRRKSMFDTMLDYASNAFHVQEKQIHFQRNVVLQCDINKERLSNGKYDLPFCVTLPYDGLYSTMRSVHGFIRYTLEVFTIDEDGAESRAEKEIVILAPIDEQYNIGIGRSMEKILSLPQIGKITLSGTLESQEYCPGDTVRLVLNCQNESSLSVRPLVKLYQIQSFNFKEHYQTWETVLNDGFFKAEIIEPQGSCAQIIRIPLSKNLVHSLRSNMIDVSYQVHILIDQIPGMYDFSMSIPFVLISGRMLKRKPMGVKSFHQTIPIQKAATTPRQISAPLAFQDSPNFQQKRKNQTLNFV